MPKVSVILTSYNHERYIREAIESTLKQTFTDFELIIWDDASIDASWEIISSYKDSRIHAFRNDDRQRQNSDWPVEPAENGLSPLRDGPAWLKP